MKEKIHPKYDVVTVTCACGASFETRSTMKSVKLDICSACHPFFTGKQKMLDTEGRVEKFNKKFASTKGQMVARKPKTEVKSKAKAVAPKAKKVLSTAPVKKVAAKKAEKPAKKEAK
ncbi:MAG: 50S ribosomal protein L31 [Elusimicrobiota bacterium]|jgi:large subunit ribosomal protein L31|nr:50S ribosomal protein L31 [Elusimicrobiota bacterium]